MSKLLVYLAVLFISFIYPIKIFAADYVRGEVIVKFKDSTAILNTVTSNSSVQGVDSSNSKHYYKKNLTKNDNLIKTSRKINFTEVSTVVPLGTNDVINYIPEPKNSTNFVKKPADEFKKIFKLNFDKNENITSVIDEIKKDPNVEYVEPNYYFNQFAAAPNDPRFSEQWGLKNTGQGSALFDVPKGVAGNDINILQAWDVKRDSPNTQVCIIDNGFSGEVEDYKNSVWKNQNEIANNGVDDDKNGYVDDTEGWDFVLKQDSAKVGGSGHAYVSMLIISSTQNNNLEMAGVSNKSKVADVSVFGLVTASTENIVAGIKYSADIGCKIANMSLGSSYNSVAMEDALKYAQSKGMLVVAAAGNATNNNDTYPTYPASYNLDNIISVASFNSQGQISDFSNYGPNSVHIAAPGEDIYYYYAGSLYMGGGTSFAAPYVTGVASLVWDKNPTWNYKQVKDALLNGSDSISSWTSKVQNGRRLNAYKAVTYTSTPTTTYDVDGNAIVNLMDIFKHIKYVFDLPYDARFDYNGRTPITPEDTFILIKQVFK